MSGEMPITRLIVRILLFSGLFVDLAQCNY